jgi:hypothetical protein
MATLTTANSVLMLAFVNFYSVPMQIQGYAVDDAFSIANVKTAETKMGVDGILSAGYTPFPVTLEINLMADSASNSVFDAVIAAQNQNREVFVVNGTILIQGTGGLYDLNRGFLEDVSVMPGAKKVLEARKYSLTFQNISLAPV